MIFSGDRQNITLSPNMAQTEKITNYLTFFLLPFGGPETLTCPVYSSCIPSVIRLDTCDALSQSAVKGLQFNIS